MSIVYKSFCARCNGVITTSYKITNCDNCGSLLELNNDYTSKIIRRYLRKRKHLLDRIESFKQGKTDTELAETKTYYGGWDIGYFEGRLVEVEETLFELGVNVDDL